MMHKSFTGTLEKNNEKLAYKINKKARSVYQHTTCPGCTHQMSTQQHVRGHLSFFIVKHVIQ